MSENEEKNEQIEYPICPKCKTSIDKDAKQCPKCNIFLNFDNSSPEERIQKIKSYNLSTMLLKEREFLFETIYNEEELNKKILYFFVCSFVFSAFYGAIVGINFGILNTFIMALKMPLVLFATSLVCMPILFTFNIFMGAKLSYKQILTMLLICTYIISMALISLSPIMLLFTIFSESLAFLHILNLIFFIISGGIGIAMLWLAIEYFTIRSCYERSTMMLIIWTIIYVFVGMQFAWSANVFGNLTELPIFKQLGIEGNFYIALFELIKSFMAGD